jgi:hypothetical protein
VRSAALGRATAPRAQRQRSGSRPVRLLGWTFRLVFLVIWLAIAVGIVAYILQTKGS